MVPTIFHNFITPETVHLEQDLNVAVAVVLLGAYALSLLFMLKTHPDYFAVPHDDGETGSGEHWSPTLAGTVLVGASILLAVVSEVLVGSVEETGRSLGMSRVFIGVIVLAVVGGSAEGPRGAMARKDKIDLTVSIAVGAASRSRSSSHRRSCWRATPWRRAARPGAGRTPAPRWSSPC
jgi:Ca2+:H+ antiporter